MAFKLPDITPERAAELWEILHSSGLIGAMPRERAEASLDIAVHAVNEAMAAIGRVVGASHQPDERFNGLGLALTLLHLHTKTCMDALDKVGESLLANDPRWRRAEGEDTDAHPDT